MQDIFKNTPTTVVDDKLRGLVPLLQLNGTAATGARLPDAPQTGAAR